MTTTQRKLFFAASSSSSSCDWWREDDPIFESMSYRRCLSTVGHDDVENAICEHGVSISHLLAHMIASSFFSPAGCCLSRILLLRRRSNRPSFPCARPTSFRSFTALYAFVSYPTMKKRSSVLLCILPSWWKSSLFVTKENWLQLPNLATVSIHTFKTRLTLISRIHHQKNHKSHSPGRPTSASVLIWKIK